MKLRTIFICMVLAFTGCHKAAPPAIEWEYEQVDWDNNFSSVHLTISAASGAPNEQDSYLSSTSLINAMGKHHWELVSVAAGVGGESFYFKRPIMYPRETYIFEPHYKKGK